MAITHRSFIYALCVEAKLLAFSWSLYKQGCVQLTQFSSGKNKNNDFAKDIVQNWLWLASGHRERQGEGRREREIEGEKQRERERERETETNKESFARFCLPFTWVLPLPYSRLTHTVDAKLGISPINAR